MINSNKTLIIGKNSKLYNSVKVNKNLHEISTIDFLDDAFDAFEFETIIVFSLLNQDQIHRLLNKSKGDILIVGSCAGISRLKNRFKYSKIKNEQIKSVLQNNQTRLKYLIFGEFKPSNRKGLNYISDIDRFWEYFSYALKKDDILIPCYRVIGTASIFSKILSCLEFLGAPFTSLLIKYATNYSYGYSNPALKVNLKLTKAFILGSGLCSSAVHRIFKNADSFSIKSKKKKHETVFSKWRHDPIVGNKTKGGLSMFYHGVTPISALKNLENYEPLKTLNIFENTKFIDFEGYFVPRFTPRPFKISSKPLNEFDFDKNKSHLIFLCMSVKGNLEYLIKKKFLSYANISDDIVYRLGEISNIEHKENLKKRKHTAKGCYFPIIPIKDGHISFRPIFFKKIDLNFIDLKKNLLADINIFTLFEKFLRAIYLRYGIKLFEAKSWECYVQQNIEDAYFISHEGMIENKKLKVKFNESIEIAVKKIFSSGFRSFRNDVGDLMSGIHLGYDRKILKNIPNNIVILDTSLNQIPGSHPTIESYCKSYSIANNISKQSN